MATAQREQNTVRIKPSYLGLGVTFAAFLTIMNSTSPLLELAAGNWIIVTGCLIGIIIAAILARALQSILKTIAPNRQRISLPIVAIAGFALMCLSMLLSTKLPLVSGLLAGFGFLAIMTLWCVYYARLMPEESLLNATIALGIGSCLYTLCFLPFVRGVPFIYACVLLLISVIMQIKAGAKVAGSEVTTEGELSSSHSEKAKPSERIRDMITALWKPLLSAMIAAFILGLVHNPEAAGSTDDFSLVAHPLISIGAPLLAMVLVLVAFTLWKKRFTLHVFCNVVVPVAVALLLIIPMINPEPLWFRIITTLLSQASFALIALATWTSLANSVRTSGISASTTFTSASALLALSTLAGIVLVHYIGKGGQILSLILLTAFLLLMVVDFAIHDRSRSRERALQQEVFNRFLGERCDSLTERYHLTARESEILPYLARGYSHVYTAQELYVSENTVRTHVKHIYTKLDVSSREDLIKMIDTGRDE